MIDREHTEQMKQEIKYQVNEAKNVGDSVVDRETDWFVDAVTGKAHRFQSMNGTDSCWHCDHDFYHHSSPAPVEQSR